MIKRVIIMVAVFFLVISSVSAADDNMIKLNVNNNTFDVKLEKNPAADELFKKLQKEILQLMLRIMGDLKR